MEENREQPIITNTEFFDENRGEVGSQPDDLGKFKSVQALMDAYKNLQSEFTKKCQALSQYEKDKTKPAEEEQNNGEVDKSTRVESGLSQEALGMFLSSNDEAKNYVEEIKANFSNSETQNPYEVAWAKVVLSHLREDDKISDPLINQYVLSDENVKNMIIQNYLNDLSKSKPPVTISSRLGDRVSGVAPDRPKTLAEAKKLVDKMFS